MMRSEKAQKDFWRGNWPLFSCRKELCEASVGFHQVFFWIAYTPLNHFRKSMSKKWKRSCITNKWYHQTTMCHSNHKPDLLPQWQQNLKHHQVTNHEYRIQLHRYNSKANWFMKKKSVLYTSNAINIGLNKSCALRWDWFLETRYDASK